VNQIAHETHVTNTTSTRDASRRNAAQGLIRREAESSLPLPDFSSSRSTRRPCVKGFAASATRPRATGSHPHRLRPQHLPRRNVPPSPSRAYGRSASRTAPPRFRAVQPPFRNAPHPAAHETRGATYRAVPKASKHHKNLFCLTGILRYITKRHTTALRSQLCSTTDHSDIIPSLSRIIRTYRHIIRTESNITHICHRAPPIPFAVMQSEIAVSQTSLVVMQSLIVASQS
jgi:hypothetical protein